MRYVVGAILIAILVTAGLVLAIVATGHIFGPGAGRAATRGGPYRTQVGRTASQVAPHFRSVQAALRTRLDRQYLAYQWVACTATHRRFAGGEIFRCNVDFGDPHVVPYCAVLVGGALITDRENPKLDCGSRVKADEQGIDTTVSRR